MAANGSHSTRVARRARPVGLDRLLFFFSRDAFRALLPFNGTNPEPAPLRVGLNFINLTKW